VCFTSGEPTTNPALPRWVKIARDQGVRRVSVMTNARALSSEPYLRKLLAAGMSRFYVSIHGHTAKLHEGLTRTPDSFDQTVAGIESSPLQAARHRAAHLDGGDQAQPAAPRRHLPLPARARRRSGGVERDAGQRPRRHLLREDLPDLHRDRGDRGGVPARAGDRSSRDPRPSWSTSLYAPPPLLPDFNRGYVEKYAHFEPPTAAAEKLIPAAQLTARRVASETPSGPAAVRVTRADLDAAQRAKRDDCRRCRYDRACEGVWRNYLSRYGWDEFVPVEAA
jgi:hypothetical protein